MLLCRRAAEKDEYMDEKERAFHFIQLGQKLELQHTQSKQGRKSHGRPNHKGGMI